MNEVTVTLTQAQTEAMVKLVAGQKAKEPRTIQQMAEDFMLSVVKGRAVAAAKTAKDNDGKNYDAAIAMGFEATETKGEFINRRAGEWQDILNRLGVTDADTPNE